MPCIVLEHHLPLAAGPGKRTRAKCCVGNEEWEEGEAVFLVPPTTQPLHRPAARQWVGYVGKAGPSTLKGVEHCKLSP